MKKLKESNSDHLYLQVADGLEQMIADDVLRIGDKLPSVRVLSEEYGISMGTAFQAYYHLEGRGLVEARPKSGYYVRFNHKRFPQLPTLPPPNPLSHDVSVRDMIASVYGDIVSTNVINLALAVPDQTMLPVSKINKSVVNAIRNSPGNCVNYEDTQGNLELRQQVAKLAFNWGGKFQPAEIVITSGCLDAVTLCLKAVTKRGDTVALESPNYFGIYQAIESLGLKVIELPCDPVQGLDLDYLEKSIKKFNVKAVVSVPNFNNPLGSCMPDTHKKRLVKIITEHKIPLIEDDIYGELYFGKKRPKPCKYFDRENWVMHCSSLSKCLAPGYRIGWVIPGRFFEMVRELKRIQNISSPTITQAAMADYLKNGRFEYHLKNIRKQLYTQSLRYVQAIIEFFPRDTKVSRPLGGFCLWVQLNPKIDSFKLRNEALRHDVSIVPGKLFSSADNFKNCIRISFGKPWSDDIEHGIRTLGRLIKKMS